MASRLISSLLCGVIFGFGLALSGMLDPARVRGFLDVAGDFDGSLAFVLAGAVAVSMIGVAVARRLRRPVFDGVFHEPGKTEIDAPLVGGAAIFGIGWGLGGFCPGPAIASLSLGLFPAAVFTLFMLIGIAVHDYVRLRPAGQPASGAEVVDLQI